MITSANLSGKRVRLPRTVLGIALTHAEKASACVEERKRG